MTDFFRNYNFSYGQNFCKKNKASEFFLDREVDIILWLRSLEIRSLENIFQLLMKLCFNRPLITDI